MDGMRLWGLFLFLWPGWAWAQNQSDEDWFYEPPSVCRDGSGEAVCDALCSQLIKDPDFLKNRGYRFVLEAAKLSGNAPLEYEVKVPVYEGTEDANEECGGRSCPQDNFSKERQARIPVLLVRSPYCTPETHKNCPGCYGRLNARESAELARDLLAEDAAKRLGLPERVKWGKGELRLYEDRKLTALGREMAGALIERIAIEYAHGPDPLDLLLLADERSKKSRDGSRRDRPGALRDAQLSLAALSAYDAVQYPAGEPQGAKALREKIQKEIESRFREDELYEIGKRGTASAPRVILKPAAEKRIDAALDELRKSATGSKALEFHRGQGQSRPASARPASRLELRVYAWTEPVIYLEESKEILIHPEVFAKAHPKALAALIVFGIARQHQSVYRVPLDGRTLAEAYSLMAMFLSESGLEARQDIDWEEKPWLLPVSQAFSKGRPMLSWRLKERYAAQGLFGINDKNDTREARDKVRRELNPSQARYYLEAYAESEKLITRGQALARQFSNDPADKQKAFERAVYLERYFSERARPFLFDKELEAELDAWEKGNPNPYADSYHKAWDRLIESWRKDSTPPDLAW